MKSCIYQTVKPIFICDEKYELHCAYWYINTEPRNASVHIKNSFKYLNDCYCVWKSHTMLHRKVNPVSQQYLISSNLWDFNPWIINSKIKALIYPAWCYLTFVGRKPSWWYSELYQNSRDLSHDFQSARCGAKRSFPSIFSQLSSYLPTPDLSLFHSLYYWIKHYRKHFSLVFVDLLWEKVPEYREICSTVSFWWDISNRLHCEEYCIYVVLAYFWLRVGT